MRKILLYSLILFLSLLSCKNDDNDLPTLSFGRPIYILKAETPLAVELIASTPAKETVVVPFSISGTAVLDEDYTMEMKEFTLQLGESMDTVWITPKENVTPQREIRLALIGAEGYEVWNNRVTMIPVEIRDVFSCSFRAASYDLKAEKEIAVSLQVGGNDYMYKKTEVYVPFEIDPVSTAVLNEHYEIVGGKQELYMGAMKAYAVATFRFLKKEVGKDKVVLRIKEGGLIEAGGNASTTITVSGPTQFKDIEGEWRFESFTDEAFVRRMASYEDKTGADCEYLPVNNNTTDVIRFSAGPDGNTLNIDGVTGDLAHYLRNCSVEIMKEESTRLNETATMSYEDVMTVKLGKVNKNYSATNVSEEEGIVGMRLLRKGKKLELRIYDYVPTDFLTKCYYGATHPEYSWQVVGEYPMSDYYTLVFRFAKVE
ncbi:hypothetical protein [Gabonibacter chumensis]|uniref:hypothetical protein n=1 Tax=Gabonibacter chumensis TaxID=2972474 RepID=UPI002573F802|nr:hypothetical protein [Gabonibacter chumensis]MCR9012084.1 hypothetical protein [Gabonibacter chumensis]